MDAAALTPEQRDALRRRLARHRDYLAKLCARMDSTGWRELDPMRVEALKARDGVDAMLKALAAAEPPAPFLAHYRQSGEPVARDTGGTADMPWVGKRKGRRR